MSQTERIKVLGTGCAKCNKLEANVKEALAGLGKADIHVGHVTDVLAIASYGVMLTPALVIDEKPVSTGKIPSVGELQTMIEKKL